MSVTEWDCFGDGEMYPVKHSGKWVRKSDYDALAARLAEAERLLREIENDFPNRFSRRAYEYFNPRPTVSASVAPAHGGRPMTLREIMDAEDIIKGRSMNYPTPMDIAEDEDREMDEQTRSYISKQTCDRMAEVCRLRYMRLMDIQEQLLFESLEKMCKQAARYAEVFNNRQSAGGGDESGGQL